MEKVEFKFVGNINYIPTRRFCVNHEFRYSKIGEYVISVGYLQEIR